MELSPKGGKGRGGRFGVLMAGRAPIVSLRSETDGIEGIVDAGSLSEALPTLPGEGDDYVLKIPRCMCMAYWIESNTACKLDEAYAILLGHSLVEWKEHIESRSRETMCLESLRRYWKCLSGREFGRLVRECFFHWSDWSD